MVESHPIDGSLTSWQDIERACAWTALLLGNGLSMHVWGGFGYSSLFEQATRGGPEEGLTLEDQALFEALKTENFERVLAELTSAIRMCEPLMLNPRRFYERYESIQTALSGAVRGVHVNRTQVPDETLGTIQDVLVAQEWVFTTSYDLLLYWAMGFNDDYRNLCDCFWSTDSSFDPEHADVWVNATPVYFLHGALHLVVEGSGRTRKLRRTALNTLLDQFGRPIDGDPEARPLLVTEGSARDKLRAIEDNDYLSHTLRRLSECDLPFVVFGSSLGEQDQHLVDAINETPDRPVAVSIRPGRSTAETRRKQAHVRERLDAEPLLYFDSRTHPLGREDLPKAMSTPGGPR